MTSQATSRTAVTVGLNIRSARKASDLTQRRLAELIDVEPMLVSKWERGIHKPHDANLMLVAEVTGRSFEWFFAAHTPVTA